MTDAKSERRCAKADSSTRRDQRNAFQKDRDRILYSDAFRRLQGVTQVVSADEGVVVHNRLTHSLKVAQIARRLAEYLSQPDQTSAKTLEAIGGLDPDVAESASLAHDLGHPPFGHVAEHKLQELTGQSHFEGNAQSFRIVTNLTPHSESYRGLDLTRGTLNGILKYPRKRHEAFNTTHEKYGYYGESERRHFEFARHGMSDNEKSAEAELMDFADDVTFAIHDTEDFYRAGMIPLHNLFPNKSSEWFDLLRNIRIRWERSGRQAHLAKWDEHKDVLGFVLSLLNVSNSQYQGTTEQSIALRTASSGVISRVVQKGVRINESYQVGDRRVVVDEEIEMQLRMLKELVWVYVIDRPNLASQQHGHEKVIEVLYTHFYYALEKGIVRDLLPSFIDVVEQRDAANEPNARLAADMVCTLTDRQALTLYRRLIGVAPGAVARTL